MNHPPRRPISSRLRVALLAAASALLALALPAGASALPADRAYEMVSPPDKNDGDVGAGHPALFVGGYSASLDGQKVGYNSVGGWGDAPANGVVGAYLGTRATAGWSNSSLLLPVLPTSTAMYATSAKAISRDFSHTVVDTNRDLENGGEIANDLGWTYLVDRTTGEHELLTGENLTGEEYWAVAGDFQGADDFSVVYFQTPARLTPVTTGLSPGGAIVYRYTDGEREAISKDTTGTLGKGTLPTMGRPVSADGTIVYFNGDGVGGPIFRRDFSTGDDPQTVLVNASENTTEVVPDAAAEFIGASRDGSIVYFRSVQTLVDADTDSNNDIYRWESSKPAGSRLTLISADDESDDGDGGNAMSLGALVSPDGSRIYFAHDSQLIDGESTSAGLKLYAWDANDGMRFIGIANDAAPGPFFDETYPVMSENGNYFGAATGADLTGENDTGLAQIYIYDYEADQLSCASCAPGAATNSAAARWRKVPFLLPVHASFYPQNFPMRNVSDNGDVFFETPEGLLPGDTNNRYDVYTWKGDQLDLLSTGRSDDDSLFADASASGEDAFFVTRAQLVGWDVDNRLDLYDARVGGGLPEPPAVEPPCQGDDCQGGGAEAPTSEAAGSSTYEGAGNPALESKRDCRSMERKGKRLGRKAKQLKQKAKQAQGKRAKGLRQKAKKANRQAKQAGKRANRCNRGVQS